MANEKDIIQFLLSGGSYGDIKDKYNRGQMIAALLKNPDAIGKLQKQGLEQSAKYATYDPTQIYDSAALLNATEIKYNQMPAEYQPLATDFFSAVRAAGNNDTEVNKFVNDLKLNRAKSAAKYGINEGAFDSLINQLEKDRKSFATAEGSREKVNMSAFYKQREKLGIAPTTTDKASIADEYLSANVGVRGLSGVATSLEQVAKQKSKSLAETLVKQGRSESEAKRLQAQFEKQFTSVAKKKKLNAAAFSAVDLVKKTLGQ
jgi:hypothetical protein